MQQAANLGLVHGRHHADDLVGSALRVQVLLLLGIVAHLDPGSQPCPPGLGFQFTHDDAGQRGLARPVGTHKGDPLASAQGQVHVAE